MLQNPKSKTIFEKQYSIFYQIFYRIFYIKIGSSINKLSFEYIYIYRKYHTK